MGNCCSAPPPEKNDVRHKKGQRVANWKATGVIGLRAAGLKELPPEVLEVGSTRVLDAADNQLHCLPASLPTSIQRLVLSNNCLPADTLSCLATLQQLKVLLLDGNRLAAVPEYIANLRQLEVLSLSRNQLTVLPPALASLKRLRQLQLASNRLQLLPDELGDCSSLEELNARGNQLRAIPPSLSRLKRLKALQLDDNCITAVPPDVLHGCTVLASLSLHGNPLTPDALQATDGFIEFEQRRQGKYTKTLATGVLLGNQGMDEGLDRHVQTRQQLPQQ